MPRWLYFLLIFAVLAPILDFLHTSQAVLFIVAALGIIPLAALIGQAVEEVAEHTGERIGGLLFATFGNATELIISIFALAEGLVDVVRASLIGTILGNALLVLGVSVCVGCFKHGRLKFETRPASQYASLFALCIGGLVLPTIAELHVTNTPQITLAEHNLSDFIAVLLLCGYLASILFSVFRIGDKGDAEEELEPLVGIRSIAAIDRLLAYRHLLVQNNIPGKSRILPHIDNTVQAIMSHETTQQGDVAKAAPSPEVAGKAETPEAKADEHHPIIASLSHTPASQPTHEHKKPPLWRGLLLLTIATVGVAILSEILVGSIEPMAKMLGWNEAFVGLIFVPLIGGLPEYFNTISMALDKRIGMVLAASAGSSIQIALLVAPILVLVSLFTPARLDLVFSIVELAVLGIATFLFSEITKDGELVWLEGLLLILLYGMMGSTVFLFGA
jgi:Ca2+:H+ antiporter